VYGKACSLFSEFIVFQKVNSGSSEVKPFVIIAINKSDIIADDETLERFHLR
jgi:hypothetical protein